MLPDPALGPELPAAFGERPPAPTEVALAGADGCRKKSLNNDANIGYLRFLPFYLFKVVFQWTSTDPVMCTT